MNVLSALLVAALFMLLLHGVDGGGPGWLTPLMILILVIAVFARK